MVQMQADNDGFWRNLIPYCAFSRVRMKWDHPKDNVHSLLRANSVEGTATKTLGQLPVLESAVTVHVGSLASS